MFLSIIHGTAKMSVSIVVSRSKRWNCCSLTSEDGPLPPIVYYQYRKGGEIAWKFGEFNTCIDRRCRKNTCFAQLFSPTERPSPVQGKLQLKKLAYCHIS